MTPYEQQALKEIHKWKHPDLTWGRKALQLLHKPVEFVGGAVMDTPVVGDAIRSSVSGIINVCNDLASSTVRREAIYKEFRTDGYLEVHALHDIQSLGLEQVDRVVGRLDTKYKLLALGEGALTGAFGALGMAADIPALIAMNLRVISEYATYYGFDSSAQEERVFAMNVLGLASSPSDASKAVAMAQLVRIAKEVAQKRTWEQLEKHVMVKVIQEISKALGIRLTKAKLAQTVPVVGAAVGGGFNAYFTSNVCLAAGYLYRERFLARKYGSEVIEITVPPMGVDELNFGSEFDGYDLG